MGTIRTRIYCPHIVRQSLCNMYTLVDRVLPQSVIHESTSKNYSDIDILRFIPSLQEQEQLLQELIFIFATSVTNNSSQLQHHFKKIYHEHLEHKYSQFAVLNTSQVRKYFNIYYFGRHELNMFVLL